MKIVIDIPENVYKRFCNCNRFPDEVEEAIIAITDGEPLEQKPICPSAGVDCEDCPASSSEKSNKTGHWIFDEILDRHYYCSECKAMGVDYWDYCPYCGAKMTEEDKA